MLKIGLLLFTIGLMILSPVDDIIILIPLSAFVGVWIIPLMTVIGLVCLFAGAIMMGKHIMVELNHPVFIVMFAISIMIIIYLIYTEGWITLC